MPERNTSGKKIAFTIAGAASAFGTSDAIAMPSALNDAAPTTSTSTSVGQVRQRELDVVDHDAERHHERP